MVIKREIKSKEVCLTNNGIITKGSHEKTVSAIIITQLNNTMWEKIVESMKIEQIVLQGLLYYRTLSNIACRVKNNVCWIPQKEFRVEFSDAILDLFPSN